MELFLRDSGSYEIAQSPSDEGAHRLHMLALFCLYPADQSGLTFFSLVQTPAILQPPPLSDFSVVRNGHHAHRGLSPRSLQRLIPFELSAPAWRRHWLDVACDWPPLWPNGPNVVQAF